MRQFIFTISEVGMYSQFWETMESFDLSDFILEQMPKWSSDITGPCLNSLYFLSKLEVVSNKMVFDQKYMVIDSVFQKENDSNIILVLLIMSNLVSSRKRQDEMNCTVGVIGKKNCKGYK